MNRWVVGLLVGVVCIASGACGGDDSTGDATKSTSASSPTAAATKSEVPAFIGEFDRVCTTQVGFPGVVAYEAAPGVHPVVLFEDFRGEEFVESARQLPGGWAVKQDTNFDDTSDLEAAQLVACSDRVKESPTGIKCDFDDDANKTQLELVDADYELKVYAAATGELKHEQTLHARSTKCPFIATFKKGDTTFVNQPSDDDYINALKPLVAP